MNNDKMIELIAHMLMKRIEEDPTFIAKVEEKLNNDTPHPPNIIINPN